MGSWQGLPVFSQTRIRPSARSWTISTSRPERTGQGIGRLLLDDAARRLGADGTGGGLYLWVIEQNSRARQFYARAGAAEVETALLPMPDGGRHTEVRCYWPDPARLLL